jgi:hypothetical protein
MLVLVGLSSALAGCLLRFCASLLFTATELGVLPLSIRPLLIPSRACCSVSVGFASVCFCPLCHSCLFFWLLLLLAAATSAALCRYLSAAAMFLFLIVLLLLLVLLLPSSSGPLFAAGWIVWLRSLRLLTHVRWWSW